VGSGFLTRCHYRISRPLSMKKNAIFDDSPRGADFRAAQKRAHTLVLEPILRLPGPLSRRISYASGLFFTLAMHLRLLTNFPLRHLRLPLRPAQQRFASQTPRLLDQPLFRSVRLLQIAFAILYRQGYRRDTVSNVRMAAQKGKQRFIAQIRARHQLRPPKSPPTKLTPRAHRRQRSCAHPRRRPVLGPQDHDLPRGRRRGALPAGLRRQPRHHDLGCLDHRGPLGRPAIAEGGRVMARKNKSKLYVHCATACIRFVTSTIWKRCATSPARSTGRRLTRSRSATATASPARPSTMVSARTTTASGFRRSRRSARTPSSPCCSCPASARCTTSSTPMKPARAACASPPIAPKPTSRSSISRRRGRSAWTRSGS